MILIAKGEALLLTYNDLMATYEPIEEVFDLAVELIGEVCGVKEERKIVINTPFMNPKSKNIKYSIYRNILF